MIAKWQSRFQSVDTFATFAKGVFCQQGILWRGSLDRDHAAPSHDQSHDAHKALGAPRNLANHTKFDGTFLHPTQRFATTSSHAEYPTKTTLNNPPLNRKNGERPWRDRRSVRLTERPPTRPIILILHHQLRPPQVQRYQPHHQGQGPRLRPDLDCEG